MRKKIALFIIGAVLSIGAFLIYQYFTGATFSSSRRTPLAGGITNPERPPTFESRRPNGDLEYVLSTKKATPSKDSAGNPIPGQYDLTEPTGSYYTDDGKLVYIRADTGVISVDQSPQTGGKPLPKGGHLSGHVVLTYGPRESFSGTSLDLQPGQLQVRFEKDLDLNYAEQLITSPGLVHLRSDQLEFDGENLTIAFNRSMKRIELLRIDPPPTHGKNNYMLIKNIGRDTLGLDEPASTPGQPPATPAPAAPAAPAAGATPAAPTPTAPPATGPAAAAAATGPAKEARLSYKLSFGKNVTATLGQRVLTSDQLFVLFSPPTPGESKTPDTQSAAATPAGATNTANTPPAQTPPAPAKTPATAPTTSMAAAAPAPPIAPAKRDDLEVRWTGPMEMRPAADTDLQLVDRHDSALEAVGTPERPVIVKDPTYSATAGRLWFHRAEQRFELEPNGLPNVTATDTDPAHPAFGTGKLVCQGLSYFKALNTVHLKGPGSVDMPATLIGRNSQPGEKPLIAKWQQGFEIELATGGLQNAHRSPRHIVFTGPCDITSSDFHIDANTLDVLIANVGVDSKGAAKSAPEHVLATGNVHIKYPHPQGGSIDDAARPDGLNADRVELITARPAKSAAPVPALLLADGNVEAWSYQPHRENGADTGKLDKQTIYTPKFAVELEQRKLTAAARSDTRTSFSNVEAKSLTADEGVIVELQGFQPETVTATGRKLSVTTNLAQGRDLATAVIDGEGNPDGSLKFAQLSEGENKIGGEHLLLDQHTRTISIPGKGVFDFTQPAEKNKPATPVQVTWTKKMDFDGRTLMARFFGDIDAHIHDRADEDSKLTCTDELDVQLNHASKDPATGAPGKGGFKSLRAVGHVNAYGATLDPNDTSPKRKPLTGMIIQDVKLLTYDNVEKRLDIPGAGKLAVSDHRPTKPGDSAQNDRGDTRFDWGSGLTYDGARNVITFAGGVYMKHTSDKPMKGMPGASTPASKPADNNPPVELSADQLTAKLLARDPARTGNANPLEIGSGSEQKIEWVQALGTPKQDAKMTMGQDEIVVRTLTFDAVRNIATGVAPPDGIGQLTRPGQALVNFQKIEWDLTKNENAFTITGATGNIEQ